MLTPENLAQLIRLGESSDLELKEVRFAGGKVRGPSQDSLADEFAALANSKGGRVVLGVSDTPREVTGIPLERIDTVTALVEEACQSSLNPPLPATTHNISLPNSSGDMQAVIVVDIPRSLFIHLSPGGYLHRVGASKRPLPPDELARRFTQRSQSRLIRFDELRVHNASLADIDDALVSRFGTPRVQEPRETLLSKLAMATRDDNGDFHPTVAGVLMGTPNPHEWMPNAFIQAVAYAGESVVPDGEEIYQLSARDIVGPLDQQVRDACGFVKQYMIVAAKKKASGGRIDLPQFDMGAVFEALVNAVAHRDYSLHGSKIRLRMFIDRIEIYSPGALPNSMTVDSLEYRQAARNEAIVSLLSKCSVGVDLEEVPRDYMMERRGEGVPLIMERSEKISGKKPEYVMHDDNELVLTIYSA